MNRIINVSFNVPDGMAYADFLKYVLVPRTDVSISDFRILDTDDEFEYDNYLNYVLSFVQSVSYPRVKENGAELREEDLVSPFTYEEWVMLGKPEKHIEGISMDKKILSATSTTHIYLTPKEAAAIAHGIAAGRFTLS